MTAIILKITFAGLCVVFVALDLFIRVQGYKLAKRDEISRELGL